MNDIDAGTGPTMQEILDTAAWIQLDRFLREITENTEALRAIMAAGEPAEQENLHRHVQAISFYTDALERQMNGINAVQ